MRLSTKRAFALFESWKSAEIPLRIIVTPTEETQMAGSFNAIVLRVNKNSERVILTGLSPSGQIEVVTLDLATSLYESFEPGDVTEDGEQDWSFLLKVSLYDGGMILFLVLV